MENLSIVKLNKRGDLTENAANWFSKKWLIDKQLYMDSIKLSMSKNNKIPQWYLILNNKDEIIGGAGVIQNDFHRREDLTPNLCALYIEDNYRGMALGKKLLDYIRGDLFQMGYNKVYLLTDHIGYYEKYGWSFLDLVEDLEGNLARVYVSYTS